MSQIPKPYDRKHPFGSASSNNPSNPIQGTDLDAEFNAVEVSMDQTQARLAEIQRDDGKLRNASVGKDQLAQDALDYVTEVAEEGAANITGPAIVVMNQIKADTLVYKDQAVTARDQAENFADQSAMSAASAAASAAAADVSADQSEAEAVQSAASADLSHFYYSQLSGALDALAPRTVVFDGNSAQASYELPKSIADEEFLDVFIGGLVVNPSKYAVTGTTLTFTPPPATGTQNVLVKISSSVQIMPIFVDDWGFVYESISSAEDWGEVTA